MSAAISGPQDRRPRAVPRPRGGGAGCRGWLGRRRLEPRRPGGARCRAPGAACCGRPRPPARRAAGRLRRLGQAARRSMPAGSACGCSTARSARRSARRSPPGGAGPRGAPERASLLDLMGAGEDGWVGGQRPRSTSRCRPSWSPGSTSVSACSTTSERGGRPAERYTARDFGERGACALKHGYALGPEILLHDPAERRATGRSSPAAGLTARAQPAR